MPLPVSYYDIAESQQDGPNNMGYDYEGNIFKNSMSNVMFQDQKRAGILASMETIVYEMVQQVKTIKIFFGYTMNKKYRKFN